MGGWSEIEIKANSAQLKLELGLSLAIKKIFQIQPGIELVILTEVEYHVIGFVSVQLHLVLFSPLTNIVQVGLCLNYQYE